MYLIKALQGAFPNQKPIDRVTINTWEDPKVTDGVKETGRNETVTAARGPKSAGRCRRSRHAVMVPKGYRVTEASGDVTLEAPGMAILQMANAGAVPIPWMDFASELQRD